MFNEFGKFNDVSGKLEELMNEAEEFHEKFKFISDMLGFYDYLDPEGLNRECSLIESLMTEEPNKNVSGFDENLFLNYIIYLLKELFKFIKIQNGIVSIEQNNETTILIETLKEEIKNYYGGVNFNPKTKK